MEDNLNDGSPVCDLGLGLPPGAAQPVGRIPATISALTRTDGWLSRMREIPHPDYGVASY